MAQCEYEYPDDGRRCRTAALTAVEAPDNTRPYCWNHSDDSGVVERRRGSRARGGRGSRKVVDAPELKTLLAELKRGGGDEVTAVKRLVLSSMESLLGGELTPAQFRALIGVGGRTLRDLMELELYQEMANRLGRLESLPAVKEADQWRILEG